MKFNTRPIFTRQQCWLFYKGQNSGNFYIYVVWACGGYTTKKKSNRSTLTINFNNFKKRSRFVEYSLIFIL